MLALTFATGVRGFRIALLYAGTLRFGAANRSTAARWTAPRVSAGSKRWTVPTEVPVSNPFDARVGVRSGRGLFAPAARRMFLDSDRSFR